MFIKCQSIENLFCRNKLVFSTSRAVLDGFIVLAKRNIKTLFIKCHGIVLYNVCKEQVNIILLSEMQAPLKACSRLDATYSFSSFRKFPL